MKTNPYNRLVYFIVEREAVRQCRESGVKGPWTKDPILKEWKFCNVRREDDRVTKWIAKNWRDNHHTEPDLWFAMVVARFINWPETLNYLGFPIPWDRVHFLKAMHDFKASGKKVYTGAYMVRADMDHANKYEYQEEVVFTPLWDKREYLRPKQGDSLNGFHMTLGMFHGLGSFMAAQVVADMKYVPPLVHAGDWNTFAASGPGSRRGLNRVMGREVDAKWREEEWRLALSRLQNELNPELTCSGVGTLHAQDIQNCLCEFDKYERVKWNEGQPRSRFRPTKEPLP